MSQDNNCNEYLDTDQYKTTEIVYLKEFQPKVITTDKNFEDNIKEPIYESIGTFHPLETTRHVIPKVSEKIVKFDLEDRNKTYRSKSRKELREKYLNLIKARKIKDGKKENLQNQILAKFFIYLLSNTFNIFTCCLYIAQTYITPDTPEDKLCSIIEVSFSFYFILEYIIFLFYSRNKVIYVFSWDTLIDVITIFPSMFSFFSDHNFGTSLTFLRIFRIFRVFRILRIYKTLRVIQADTSNDDSPVFKINPIKFEMFNLAFLFIVMLFIGAGFVLGLQDLINDSFNKKNLSFTDALFFILTSGTSIGFGDIIPTNTVSRLFIVFSLLFYIFMVSIQLNKLFKVLYLIGDNIKNFEDDGHFIIIADTTCKLELFLLELRSNIDYKTSHVVIISKDILHLPSTEYPFNKTHLIKVKLIDFEVLDQLNITNTRAIFIFSQKSLNNSIIQDKFTELLLLQINQFKIDPDKIFIQSLFLEQINSDSISSLINKKKSIFDILSEDDFKGFDEKLVTFKKMIPVFKIKNKILAKSIVIPGFATFIQNLLVNNYFISNNKDELQILQRNYLHGCENKLSVYPVPSCFFGKSFFYLVKNIYFRSVNEYFTKISTDKEVKPILAIGVIVDDEKHIPHLKLFPAKMILSPGNFIIFISYSGKDYLKAFLLKLEEIALKNNEPNKSIIIVDNEDDENPDIILRNNQKVKKYDIKTMETPNNNEPHLDKNEQGSNPQKEVVKISITQLRKLNSIFYKKKKSSTVSIQDQFDSEMSKAEENEEITKYKNKNTKQNLLLLKEADKNFNSTKMYSLMQVAALKFPYEYSNVSNLTYSQKQLIDLEKESRAKRFSNHILILGFQDNLSNLLEYLFYNFNKKRICIISDYNNEQVILKLLKQFKYLYFLKGNPINPNILINAGIQNALHCIILSETAYINIIQDTTNVLSYRTLDYFFNINCTIELWDSNSIRHLGYIPLNFKNETDDNEFIRPIFMNGQAIYLDHLEKIIASSLNDQDIIESWLALVNCGYSNLECETKPALDDNPLIISIELPNDYFGKEFISLMKDVMDLNAIVLGLLIEGTSEYFKLNKGTVDVNQEDKSIRRIVTSHRMTLKKKKSFKSIESVMDNFNQIIKENSYNKKAIMNFVDLNSNHFPIFITNPPPGFILVAKTKVMILLASPSLIPKESIRVIEEDLEFGFIFDKLINNKKHFTSAMDMITKKYDEAMNKTIKKLQKLIKKNND